MSDEQAPVTEAPAAEETPVETPAERTYTKADIEAAIKKRLAKFSDYEDVKARAAKADELEAAQMSELEKATKAAAEMERRYSELESKVQAQDRAKLASEVAVKVAKEMGKDLDAAIALADILEGDDEDSMVESAKTKFAYLRGTAPEPVPGAVNDVQDPVASDPFLVGLKGA